MKMQSVITPQERFARIESPKIQRSTFDRSHGYKTTLDAGKLIPVFLDEALPGDTFNLKATMFGRLSTPLKPIMDNIFVDLHFFSVPMRLLWNNWEKMNGEQDNPGDTTNYLVPEMRSTEVTGYGEQSIFDYMGLPTKQAGVEHSAMFLRAYNLIWNDWYRDQNLQNSVPVPRDDGPDSPTSYAILPRGKRKDYFTSALPWAQKSTPVSIPLGTSAPVYGQQLFTNPSLPNANYNLWQTRDNDTTKTVYSGTISNPGGAGVTNLTSSTLHGATSPAKDGLTLSLGTKAQYTAAGANAQPPYADLSAATSATINALREAFQIQKMFEKDARGGTRYIELIRQHFGVISPDARLQRPEFLGGGSSPINITPIVQNSASTDGVTPQGNLAAMGTFNIHNNGFVKSFVEHEIVIGLISIRADLNYQQGLHRMWSRRTRFEFYWPSFAHLGEQAILSKEIYSTGANANDNSVFGYQERFAEYRYKPSQITGLYRSNATQSLDIWHLAQDFSARPTLNAAFIEENPPIDRIIATPDEPQFLLDCFYDFKTARPMPTFATPGFIDQF